MFLTPVGIYWRLFTDRASTPLWVQLAAFGVLVVFVGTAMRIETLRPIRTFLLTVLALGGGLPVVGLIEQSTAWTRWAARTSSRTGRRPVAVLMTSVCSDSATGSVIRQDWWEWE